MSQRTIFVSILFFFSAVFFVLIIDFEGGGFSRNIVSKLAGVVGVSVGVAPNPVNTLVRELEEKESALNAREQELADRERNEEMIGGRKNSASTFFLFGVVVLLLLLVLLNFYFDYRHRLFRG